MRCLVALLIAALLGSVIAPATVRAQTPYQQILDQAVAGGMPGVQAVVLRGGGEWAGAAGLASVERGERMSLGHRLRVASITKMMTYAVIMELARQGRLALDDRAAARLPAGTLQGIPNAEAFTIEQLLGHTSGVHNFNGENGADFFQALYGDPNRGSRLWTARELIAFARRRSHPPTGTPGAAQAYSSTGYIILELIAEHVGGQPLPELYRRLIFDRFGLRQSGFEGYDLAGRDIGDSYARPPIPAPGTASPFDGRRAVRPDGLVNLSAGLERYNAWARGAGAAASTACDLARFMRAIVRNDLTVIGNQAAEFRGARERPNASFNWNGGSAGIQASIFYAPAHDAIVIVLTNGSNLGDGSLEIGRRLLNAVREGPPAGDSPPSGCARQGSPLRPLAAVQEVILDYERSFRTGDVEAMRRAFAPDGAYLSVRPLNRVPLGRSSFAEAFADWAGAPDPHAWVDVDEISFVGERTALVRLRLHYRGGTYLDQLGLYRLGTDWRIVSKQSEAAVSHQ